MLKKYTFIASALLCAQITTASSQNPEITEVVSVATRAETAVSDIIGSVALLDEGTLNLVSHSHIQESLSRLAGVNLHRGNGQEYLPAVRSPVLTGAGGCGGFLMAEDGIPLRAAGFCNINELFEAHTEMAQRIEVLRGTGTALYGSNAMHGIINVVTPGISDQRRLALEVGADDYRRLKLHAGTDNLSVAASLTHDGGYRDQSGFDQQKVSLRHSYAENDLTIDTGMTLTNLNQETAGFIVGLNAYEDRAQIKGNLNPEAYRDVKSARVWSRVSRTLGDNRLVITPYLRDTKMDFLQHFLPGDPLEENGQQSAGVQLGYYGELSDGINLIAGIDAELTDAYLKQSQDSPTQGSPFLQATIPVGMHYDYQVDASMVAPFINLDWGYSQRLKLNAGLRFESVRYDYNNNMLAGRTAEDGTECGFGGCRYSRPESGKNSFDNWSSNLGASYVLSSNQDIYMRLAKGFRAPQAAELYRLQRAQQITDLESESIDSIELGLTGRYQQVSYKLAFYHMEKDQVIFRDSDFFNVSDGNTEHQGVELELDYRINQALTASLSATQARHTYLDSSLLDGVDIRGNDIDTAPRSFGSVRLAWTPNESQSLELEWQSMGSYYLDPENLHSYQGHDLMHLRGSLNLSPAMRLFANISNLTDKRYAERADYTGFTQERYFPGMPRTARIGIEMLW
ncbi:MAG: TonB-dependent receptor [Porticoccaceae bacterium]|mgnify:CR=1 FL=1|nr:TonB-dependent receptor [Porticoccaceae bacterium]